MTEQAIRERLVQWSDPMLAARQALQMDGLTFLQAMVAGKIAQPPIAALINMALTEAEKGRAVFQLEPDESHYNPIGTVHGGVIATICDSAASCAVHTHLSAGQAYTTLEMKVNYVRPVSRDSARLICTGETLHDGRRTATAMARLEDGAGKLYAHATVTCLIFSLDNNPLIAEA